MYTDIVFVLDVKCTYMKIVFLCLNNYCIIFIYYYEWCIYIYIMIFFFFIVHTMCHVLTLNNKRRGKTSSLLKKYDFVFRLFI